MWWDSRKSKKRKRRKKKAAPVGGGQSSVDSQGQAENKPANTGDGPNISADKAVDFLAEFLRILGDKSFDLDDVPAEEVKQSFDRWAQHLLVGVAPPGRELAEVDPESTAQAPRNLPRDLPGLRLFLSGHREHEQSYVTGALGNLREAIWVFIHGLRRSFSADQASDTQIGYRMRRLEGAVRSNVTERIKSEATETISLLNQLVEERGERQREQLKMLAARLEHMRSELDNARQLAAIDALTQLYNRASFDEQIERELDFASLFGRNICLAMIDIDDFKWVNDTHGHRCGDEVLRRVAACIAHSFPRKDDFVARYGGEEFVAILREVDGHTAGGLTERCMLTVRHMEVDFEGIESLRVSISVGISQLRIGDSSAQWIERADQALYRAKEAGKDRVEVDSGGH